MKPCRACLVEADRVEGERDIHESDGADAGKCDLEFLALRQVRVWRGEEAARPQQLVEYDREAEVEERERQREVEAGREDLRTTEATSNAFERTPFPSPVGDASRAQLLHARARPHMHLAWRRAWCSPSC